MWFSLALVILGVVYDNFSYVENIINPRLYGVLLIGIGIVVAVLRFVTSKDEAFEMITRASPFLRSLEGARLQGGPKETTFNNLMFVEDVTKPAEIDLENPEDEKLRALSEGLLNGD
jgi:hypothetical protein